MKILIINSDSPNNRGDRAILAGNLELIKKTWPSAEIWALSEYPDRDHGWFGINFLDMSAYSTNPIKLAKLAWFGRNCDYVFWGGGEILKDYTNKIGVIYWWAKISTVRIFNKNIYGLFQGIGPTKGTWSKKLIVSAVNKTRLFLVRDKESEQKLRKWGAKTPIVSSFDPSVFSSPQKIDQATMKSLSQDYDIDQTFLKNCVGVGVRKWFHYKKSGFLPFKFRLGGASSATSQDTLAYAKNLASLCDWIITSQDVNLLFFPMHMSASENDADFSRSVVTLMKHSQRTRIIEKDTLSPQQYLNLISVCKLFVGARLHSSILAASASVPSLVFYYVDKGRVFFEQIGMSKFSQPIEELLLEKNLEKIKNQINLMQKDKMSIQHALKRSVTQMRRQLRDDFRKTVYTKK